MVDPQTVVAVLLSDGWHEVDREADPMFELVQHGFAGGEHAALTGRHTEPGFLMVEVGAINTLLTGSLSSILAVRCRAEL